MSSEKKKNNNLKKQAGNAVGDDGERVIFSSAGLVSASPIALAMAVFAVLLCVV